MSGPEHTSSKSIGRRLHLLDRCLKQYLAEELGDLDIGPGQFPFLMALYRGDGITQEELTERVTVDKATTARAVKKLLRKGYVVRERDPEDRRAYRLRLTKKALDLRPRLRRTLKGATAMLTEGLTEREKETLRRLLDKMAAGLETRGKGGCG